jgi:hypothetical protein
MMMLHEACIMVGTVRTQSAGKSRWKLQIESFKTHKQAMDRIKEIRASLSIQPEKERDPEDPNADTQGYVWVISVSLPKNPDKLYLCTDGHFR